MGKILSGFFFGSQALYGLGIDAFPQSQYLQKVLLLSASLTIMEALAYKNS